MKIKRKPRKYQFSLLEIIIAISIVSMIVAIAAPSIINQGEVAKTNIAIKQMINYKKAIATYKLETGKLPNSLADLATSQNGNKALLPKVKKDPWKNDFIYEINSEMYEGYEIISYGADGQIGGTEFNADIKLSEL